MFAQSPFSPGIATGVVPAPQLLIGYPEAWLLILLLLALCCGVLWLLTRPVGTAAEIEASCNGTRGRKLFPARGNGKKAVGVAVRISPQVFDARPSKSRSLNLVKVRS